MSTFSCPYTISLHDSDAAGIIFAANLIRICHQAYEKWMEEIGFSIGRLLKERPFGLPLAHIEGDFMKPLRVGDHVEIRLRVAHVGTSSYRIGYDLIDASGDRAATSETVHVCVDLEGYRPMELPVEFRAALEKFVT